MKTATKRKTKLPPIFKEEYRSAFGEYAQRDGEAALNRAYDLGRRAISEKKSLMEIAVDRFGTWLGNETLDSASDGGFECQSASC
jgi:hypothetical protein